MLGTILSNARVKVESGMSRYTKYEPNSNIPSVMTFSVECKSKLEF